MKPVRAALLALAAGLGASVSQAQPVIIDLPARAVWCVASQPVVVDQNQSAAFASLLFNTLYSRLEKAALAQQVPSLGVPFADALEVESAPVGTVAAGAGPAASAPSQSPRYVLRVCANVPPGIKKPAETHRVEIGDIPAVKAYASLCDAKDDTPCRQALQARIQVDLMVTPAQADAVQWQVGQPLNERPEADALRAALIDYKARPLVKDVPVPQLPQGKLILWAPVPTGK